MIEVPYILTLTADSSFLSFLFLSVEMTRQIWRAFFIVLLDHELSH